jgi:RNA polymerase sigma-70 factor, ECF subfamily
MCGERADAELLSTGVASDFGCFYDRHVRAVTAFVGSWIGEPDVVFDLVAETFARALEHRLQYDASKGPAVAWLWGIARNLMIDSARPGAGGVGQSRASWDRAGCA